jgi:hypothetical protein
VTIYVKAGTLADDNGRIFPAVDTAIGTYAYSPSTTSGSSALPGTPSSQPSSLVRQAVSQQQTTETSPLTFVLAVLSALVVAGCLLVFPRRR